MASVYFDVETQKFVDGRVYVIYGLIDPRDDLIHYIGRTIDLPSRLWGHAFNRAAIPDTAEWIANLEIEGLLPKVRIYGNVQGLDECGEVERNLIRKYFVEGHPLKNRQGLYAAKTGQLVKQVQELLDNQ